MSRFVKTGTAAALAAVVCLCVAAALWLAQDGLPTRPRDPVLDATDVFRDYIPPIEPPQPSPPPAQAAAPNPQVDVNPSVKRGVGDYISGGISGGVVGGVVGGLPEAPPPTTEAMRSPPAIASVPRYAAVDAPERVQAEQEFGVVVSLTVANTTPDVRIQTGARTADGRLELSLPAGERAKGWDIDIAVSAPAFTFRSGVNTATLHLEEQGDSTPALFHLTPTKTGTTDRTIYVTFWFRGGYIGKVARAVRVETTQVQAPDAATTLLEGTTPQVRTGFTISSLETQVADLTIWENPDTGEVLIDSPYLQPARGTFEVPASEMASWIRGQLEAMATLTSRGISQQSASATAARLRIEGFGEELYRRFAPRVFKDAFLRLRNQLGPDFDTIFVMSSNPVLPWELMRPSDGERQARFLGADFRLGRWHVSNSPDAADRPPQVLTLERGIVLAPRYSDAMALSSQAEEVEFLTKLPGFRTGPGRLSGVLDLMAESTGALLHFAGHGRGVGDARDAGGALLLEDGEIDPLVLKGARKPTNQKRATFVFLNACDVGQSQRRANFVEGWAPTVLETGAAGFVGGLWPLPDRSAARFAMGFYGALGAGPNRRTLVAEALRVTRARFYETGDPTYLAYAYYGDPNLMLTLTAK
jgi:hypothetical protein